MENAPPCKLSIDWKLLSEANSHYTTMLRSTYIETPWIVDQSIANITTESREITTKYGRLVGSAEQGFLQLLCGKSPKMEFERYYHSISPCFRDDELDDLHERHFMKLELIYPIKKSSGYTGRLSILEHMMAEAKFFFDGNGLKCRVQPTESGRENYNHDLVGNNSGIEIGSYGIREFGDIMWVYGTGLALPRFSQVKEKENG